MESILILDPPTVVQLTLMLMTLAKRIRVIDDTFYCQLWHIQTETTAYNKKHLQDRYSGVWKWGRMVRKQLISTEQWLQITRPTRQTASTFWSTISHENQQNETFFFTRLSSLQANNCTVIYTEVCQFNKTSKVKVAGIERPSKWENNFHQLTHGVGI